MTDTTVFYRFRCRGGTAADLATVNEIPLSRELVVETDTGKMKLGDGVTAYNALAYMAGGAPLELQKTATHIQWRPVGGPDWFDLVPLEDITGDDGDDGREVALRFNATHMQWQYVGDPGWTDLIAKTALTGPAGPAGPSSSCFPTASFDGGLDDILVGASCDLFVPFGFTITRATLLGDSPGTLQIDIRVETYAAHPPGPTDTICGGTPPTLASTDKVQDATLTGWTTVIAAGSVIRFIVTASSGVRKANLVLEGSR